MKQKNAFDLGIFIKEHRRDLVLLLSLVLVIAAITLALALTREPGGEVKVEIDGVEVARYSLSENGEYKLGDGNLLVIEGGEAYMRDADCPDRTCVKSGRVSSGGQTIICLPNRIAVTVVPTSGEPDLVS